MKKETVELIEVCSTTYYYFRFWIKPMFVEAKIEGFKFNKDNTTWNGTVQVPKTKKKEVIALLKKWENDNKECETPWTNRIKG